MTRRRALLTSLLVLSAAVAPVLGPAAPAHADQDVAECVADGTLTTGTVDVLPGWMSFTGALVLDCLTVGTGDDGGTWTIGFAGSSSLASCAGGTGSGNVTGGSTSHDGSVTGGSFSYVHAGVTVSVRGTVYTAGDGSRGHHVSAELALIPGSLSCPTGGTSGLSGQATILDGLPVPSVQVGGAACAVAGLKAYGSLLDVGFFTRGVDMEVVFDCIGLAPAGGWWQLALTGAASGNCAVETGSAVVVTGSSSPSGPVSGGVSWVRVGVNMTIDGWFATSGWSHVFTATVAWAPAVDCAAFGTYYGSFSGPGAMVSL